MITDAENLANKRLVQSAMNTIAESSTGSLGAALAKFYHPDALWRGSHPWNEIKGVEAIERVVWGPLLHSFPDLERRDDIIMGGDYEGRAYVGAVGHLAGTFRRDWNGIPATGKVIYLRYGEFHQVANGKIVHSTVLMDVMDFIRQAGFWPIAPSLGYEGMWSGPITGDGLVLQAQDPAESATSLKQVLDMHASLGGYDDSKMKGREGLLTMPQVQYWHPKMMWYGPSGIGTTRALEGFVDQHQLPFRIAFPNRSGGNHYVRIGDGKYAATAGWPSVRADHLGGDWLGLSPTGRKVTMRVMDFYLCHEGLIRENWVPIDIINLLLQMDVDVLARVRSQFGKRSASQDAAQTQI